MPTERPTLWSGCLGVIRGVLMIALSLLLGPVLLSAALVDHVVRAHS